MKSSLARAFLVAVLIAASTSSAQITQFAESSRKETPRPTILVFNYSQASPTTIRMAEVEASQILGKAGFPAAWVNCPMPSLSNMPGCEKEQSPGEVRVRILAGHTQRMFQDSVFGFTNPPVFASVYYESALRLAKIDNAEFEVPVILGCIMAHEIGHLLLGPNSHTATGIMQPRWESEQVRQIMKGELEFTKQESMFIQAGVRRWMNEQPASAETQSGAP